MRGGQIEDISMIAHKNVGQWHLEQLYPPTHGDLSLVCCILKRKLQLAFLLSSECFECWK